MKHEVIVFRVALAVVALAVFDDGVGLLIRGLAGQEQEELNRAYYDAAREPKELWEVPGAGHTRALETAPAAYERRVVGFFDHALLR